MFFLLQIWRTGGLNRFCWGEGRVGISWRGRWWRRGRRVNTVPTVYTHVYKCKNENCFRNQGRGNGEEKWRGKFKYDIYDT
jgi:hypothetical protein